MPIATTLPRVKGNLWGWGVGQLLLIVFFLALFVVAPVKAAAIFAGAVLLASLVVQRTAASVAQTPVSLSDSFKAIVYALFFSAVALFTQFSFMKGASKELFANPAAIAVVGWPLIAMQYGAYLLGFKIALGLTFLQSAVVAIASTVITSGAIWLISALAISQV